MSLYCNILFYLLISPIFFIATQTLQLKNVRSSVSKVQKWIRSKINDDCDEKTRESFLNPPFFPTDLEALAYDSTFSVKIALTNKYKRIRVDLTTRITNRGKRFLDYLIYFANFMIDEEFKSIRLFMDTSHADTFNQRLKDFVMNNECEKDLCKVISVSPINDLSLKKDDCLYAIFCPDNTLTPYVDDGKNILEEVQVLCFHAAMRKIPMILINPRLIATGNYDKGMFRSSSLLRDFVQCYYINDNYIDFGSPNKWCGIIRRLTFGYELYLLDGFPRSKLSPERYQRLKSWNVDETANFHDEVISLLAKDETFLKNLQSNFIDTRNVDKDNIFAVYDDCLKSCNSSWIQTSLTQNL
jgi:hypothetical protein